MKALCLALLLTNVLFFIWTRWHGSATPVASSSSTLEKAPELLLATEGEATAAVSQERGHDPTDVRCQTVGPFQDLPSASQASANLRSSGHEPRTRVAEQDVWAGLWVYLEDLPSRTEAQRVMAVLKSRGIDDAYIMPSSGQGSNISLGIFSEPPRAQRRAAEVRKLGFSPTVTERSRKATVYWLDMDSEAEGSPIELGSLAENAAGKILRLEVKPCPAASKQ